MSTAAAQENNEDTPCIIEITTANSVHQISIPRRSRVAKSPPLRNAVESLMKGGIFSAVLQQGVEESLSRGHSRGAGAKSSLGEASGKAAAKKKRSRSTIMNMKKELDDILTPLVLPSEPVISLSSNDHKPQSTSPRSKVSRGADEQSMPATGGKTKLMLAAMANDVTTVQRLINDHGKRTPEGKTALMLAAENGATGCIQQLVGWEAGMVSNNGWTAIMYSIAAQQLEAVELLAQRKEELHSVTKDGRTPLIFAAEQGYEDIVQIFISSKLVGMKTTDGRTALMQAAWNRHLACVRWLADKECGLQDADGKTALILTLESKNTTGRQSQEYATKEFVQLLKPEIDKAMPDGTTTLMCAVLNLEEDCIPLLVSELGKRQKVGRTALMLATRQGSLSTLRELLPEACIKDGFGKSALYYALEGRNMTHIRELRAEYALLNEGNMSMIMTAITLGNEEAALIMLNELQNRTRKVTEAGSGVTLEVQVTKKEQKTALMFAVEARSLPLVEKLVELEHSYQDNKGSTALMYAAELEFCEAIPILLAKEEGIRNNAGHTALMQMAMNKNVRIVPLLLSEACTCDNFGMTALMYAAQLGHQEIVATLLATNEVGVTDNADMTALMYAAMNGHAHCVSLLAPREHHYARACQLLLNKGVPADQICSNSTFYSGHTAIIVAAMYNNVDCIKQLIPWEAWVVNEYNRLPSVAVHVGTYSKDVQNALAIKSIHRIMKMYYAKRRNELGSCNICLNKIASMKCYPCNHVVCCEECAERLAITKKPCPLCRGAVLFWITQCYDLEKLTLTIEPNYEWINFPSDEEEGGNDGQHLSESECSDDELYVEIPLDREIQIKPSYSKRYAF